MNLLGILNRQKRNIFVALFLLFLSTIFVLLFSVSTSPIFSNYYESPVLGGGDSLQFQTIGKSWTNGKIPYSEAFDHKGPLIFLADALGFLLGNGSRYGIIFLQIIALFITLIFIWKISQLAKKSLLWGTLSVILTLIFMVACYAYGNSVQEYTLPFILPSIYFLIKYFYNRKQAQHNPKIALIYGISIGACLLLQPTHAIFILAGILVISILLIKQKQWKNLLQNLGYGILGILIIYLPFAIYFLANGAFNDFIYASIIYNFSYASHIGSWLHSLNSETFTYFITSYFPYLCLFIASLLAFYRKKFPYATTLLISVVIETYLFLSGAIYGHYCLAFIFQVGILLNEIILLKKDDIARFLSILLIGIITIIAYQIITDRYKSLLNEYNIIKTFSSNKSDCTNLMDRNITQIYNNSFTAYGANSLKNVYLQYNLTPNNTFFTIQDWHSKFSNQISEEIQQDFKDNPPNFILIENNTERSGIQNILDDAYSIYDTENQCALYRKNL